MKKLTSALLALILCLSLAACGAGTDAALPSAAVETAVAETPAATMPPVTAASPSPTPEPAPSATPTATAAPSVSAAHSSEPAPVPTSDTASAPAPTTAPSPTPEPVQESAPASTTAPVTSTPSAQPSSGTGGTQGGGVSVPSPESGGNLVWIPTNGGTRYHSHSGCSGMIDPIQVSVETALANGFTRCGRCW